jgi:tetratricopeptide (TPR) repeat protein
VHSEKVTLVSFGEEIALRKAFVREIQENLVLETKDPVMDNGFALAKLRAAESVFKTKGGLMHCPGGQTFYAAVWTNDQVEYAGPFFPYLGEENAIEASRNAYELYLPFMGEDYYRIPTSIIAEGIDIWEGAGDRGDAAMYAYGAARFALEMGNKEYAEHIFPAIEWCLEYCRRQKTIDGVIASDSDELEGRFETGNANLSTSSLTYAAYINAACLAEDLGKMDEALLYREAAASLRTAIESYFGATVEGYDTYRYYEGNDKLRAWICLPLVFGIEERKDATVSALFSENLWMPDGLATESGDTVFWDRSTLYALRGVFSAGEKEKAYEYLRKYTERRTLGEHVPYPVEAWPEGNQRHLSAESALYCRIFTEGILGLEAVGIDKVKIRPQFPVAWKKVSLKKIHLCGQVFDLEVETVDGGYRVDIVQEEKSMEYSVQDGELVTVKFGVY